MTEQKYCPLQKEGMKCARWCAWYDEAELVAMDEVVQYAITEKGQEYLKGKDR